MKSHLNSNKFKSKLKDFKSFHCLFTRRRLFIYRNRVTFWFSQMTFKKRQKRYCFDTFNSNCLVPISSIHNNLDIVRLGLLRLESLLTYTYSQPWQLQYLAISSHTLNIFNIERPLNYLVCKKFWNFWSTIIKIQNVISFENRQKSITFLVQKDLGNSIY